MAQHLPFNTVQIIILGSADATAKLITLALARRLWRFQHLNQSVLQSIYPDFSAKVWRCFGCA